MAPGIHGMDRLPLLCYEYKLSNQESYKKNGSDFTCLIRRWIVTLNCIQIVLAVMPTIAPRMKYTYMYAFVHAHLGERIKTLIDGHGMRASKSVHSNPNIYSFPPAEAAAHDSRLVDIGAIASHVFETVVRSKIHGVRRVA